MIERLLPRLTATVMALSTAQAAEIRLEGNNADGVPVVSVQGDFVERDIERFADVTKDLDSAVIVFESDGGAVVAGIEIGTRIRLRGYQTVVDNNTGCFSACAIAWLGGTTRYIGRGAQVGFHAAYRERGGRAQETGVGNALVGGYANSLGLRTQAIVFLTSAPPEELNRLTEALAQRVGIAAEFADTKKLVEVADPTLRERVSMSDIARDIIGVLLGEAVRGSRNERFNDMLGISSTIANRAAELGVDPQDVISAQGQYQAYGKALPEGANAYKDLAQQAWDYVNEVGPVHCGTYFAKPNAIAGLKKSNPDTNLQEIGRSAGYFYFQDTNNAPIVTARGTRNVDPSRRARGCPSPRREVADPSIAFYKGQEACGSPDFNGFCRAPAEAVEWLRLASDQGHAEAQYSLGVMYDGGWGVPQDYAQGYRWYRMAADQGHAVAQSIIGSMYYYGRGVPQDYAEGYRWYRMAADQGHAVAQFSLGYGYANGRGVPQDYAEAVRWFRRAAQQGYGGAQYNLGFMYVEGQGIPQNIVLAHMWFNLAAAQGNEVARSNRDRIAREMSPGQIAEAERLAREWKQTSR